MTNFEAIGRYHVAVKRANELVSERNSILSRAALVLKNVTEHKPQDAQIIGKHCNFDALHNLLAEAKGINDELVMLVEEINSLAPLAGEAEIKLS